VINGRKGRGKTPESQVGGNTATSPTRLALQGKLRHSRAEEFQLTMSNVQSKRQVIEVFRKGVMRSWLIVCVAFLVAAFVVTGARVSGVSPCDTADCPSLFSPLKQPVSLQSARSCSSEQCGPHDLQCSKRAFSAFSAKNRYTSKEFKSFFPEKKPRRVQRFPRFQLVQTSKTARLASTSFLIPLSFRGVRTIVLRL
jgi:hypothetical protein